MNNKQKIEIIRGEHKGTVGTLKGVLLCTNMVLIETDDGEEIAVKPNEFKIKEK